MYLGYIEDLVDESNLLIKCNRLDFDENTIESTYTLIENFKKLPFIKKGKIDNKKFKELVNCEKSHMLTNDFKIRKLDTQDSLILHIPLEEFYSDDIDTDTFIEENGILSDSIMILDESDKIRIILFYEMDDEDNVIMFSNLKHVEKFIENLDSEDELELE